MAVLQTLPKVTVVILCDEEDPAIQAGYLAQGAQDVLLKSTVNPGELLRAARNAVARKARDLVVLGNNERARMTLASIGDAVLSTDTRWIVTFINPVAERLTGWTSTEAVGKPISAVFRVIDGVTRVRVVPQLEIAIETGNTPILPPNCILMMRNGEELHIEDSAAPILDVSGTFVGMVVVFHDVSASRAQTQRMSHPAEHDPLTSLPNRALLNDRLEHGMALAHRNSRQIAVLHRS